MTRTAGPDPRPDQRTGGATAVDLVIIGHFGFAEDHTPFGSRRSLGGSGYACAVGASAAEPERVGVVAEIGHDFDVAALRRLRVDLQGVRWASGPAPRLSITQHSATYRSFAANLGVAAEPAIRAFPPSYAAARHVHLATMPPRHQAQWLGMIRQLSRCTISVDMFERTASDSPQESRQLCRDADLVFMNEEECRLLFTGAQLPGTTIVKRGERGARYRSPEAEFDIPAPSCGIAVDTTGAGEVLAGVFLSVRSIGMAPIDALRYGVRAASAKVTEFGVDGPVLRRVLSEIRAEALAATDRSDQ